MSKEKLLKELLSLEKHAKEKCIENNGDWQYKYGVMYTIGWLTSAFGMIEDYEKLKNLNDEDDA